MKKTIVLILSLVLAISMVGCGKAAPKTTSMISSSVAGEQTADPTDPNAVVTPAPGKGYLLVDQFLSKLQSGDTADIMDMVYVKDATLITAKDVVWALQRNGLSDLVGDTSIKYTLESKSKMSDSESVDVLDSTGTTLITLQTILDNENNWKIDITSDCVENFQIAVPAGASVTFNSIPVDAKYITGTYGDYDLQSIITLPIVTGQTVSVDVATSFGTLTSDVLPVTSDEPLDLTAIPTVLTDADAPLAVAAACYQTAYEKSATTGKVPAADISAYFSLNAKPSVLTDVSNNITDQTEVSLSNLAATKITVETNSVIAIEFSCVYNWKWFGTALKHDLDTTLLMEKQADGTYLIFDVPDMDFFLEPIFH